MKLRAFLLASALTLGASPSIAQQALPGLASSSGNPPASAANQQRIVQYVDASNSALAASATFNGAIHAVTGTYNKVNIAGFLTQSGSYILQACFDAACGVTVFQRSGSTSGSASFYIEAVPIIAPYYRLTITNSTAASTIYVDFTFSAS